MSTTVIDAGGVLMSDDLQVPTSEVQQQLSAWLERTLGGTVDQIRLAPSPDHLTLVVSIIPLMRIAGGKWAELVKDMP